MAEDLCAVCQLPPYEGCRNSDGCGGNILVIKGEDTVIQTCPNMKRLRLRRFLESIDPQLVKPGVKHDRNSPLYQPATEKRKKVDLTKQNLLIKKIAWNAFIPHLKWVAGCKGQGWFCRVVTDRTLLNIFVGNTSVKVRRFQSDADGLLQVNSIEDHLKDPDLVIIRMGLIVHSNKAAGNVLAETLRMREADNKPTWLVEPEDQEFSPYSRNEFGLSIGMVICTETTAGYVDERFTKVNLKTQVEVVEEELEYYEDEDGNLTIGDDIDFEEGEAYDGLPEVEDKPEPAEPPSTISEESEDDEDEEEDEEPEEDEPVLWEESNASKKKKSNWRRR